MHSHFQAEPFSKSSLEPSIRSLQIAPLSEQLLPEAVVLDQQVFGGFWTIESYAQELKRPSSTILAIGPKDITQPPTLLALGCSWLILEECHILMLAVHPDYRRWGLGTATLLGLLEQARHQGAEYATLEVGATNHGAIHLYEKLGLKVAGRRPRYYEKTGEDALVMWRSGLQTLEFETQLAEGWQDLTHRYPWQWHKPQDPHPNFSTQNSSTQNPSTD